MIDLTPAARTHLDGYLDELRHVLSGPPSVDAADVERDVRDHIESALAGHTAPVDLPDLDAVLRELGPPAQWVPDEDIPWYRRARDDSPATIRSGAPHRDSGPPGQRDTFRLALLSPCVLAVGFCLLPAFRGIESASTN
jgi:hypothetical protein